MSSTVGARYKRAIREAAPYPQPLPGANQNQSYLVLHSGLTAGNAIDKLLCQPPKHGC